MAFGPAHDRCVTGKVAWHSGAGAIATKTTRTLARLLSISCMRRRHGAVTQKDRYPCRIVSSQCWTGFG